MNCAIYLLSVLTRYLSIGSSTVYVYIFEITRFLEHYRNTLVFLYLYTFRVKEIRQKKAFLIYLI